MKLELYYPIKPYIVSQEWGVHRPDVYLQFGFEDHNGVDILLGDKAEVRAPFPYIVTSILWQPNGGGRVIGITSQFEYDGPDGKPANVQFFFLHLEKILKAVGDKGSIGDLLAIADNTGYSTGLHTHLGPKWVRRKGAVFVDVEKNKANNTFDPKPYYNGKYAYSYYLENRISLLTQLANALQKLLSLTRG